MAAAAVWFLPSPRGFPVPTALRKALMSKSCWGGRTLHCCSGRLFELAFCLAASHTGSARVERWETARCTAPPMIPPSPTVCARQASASSPSLLPPLRVQLANCARVCMCVCVCTRAMGSPVLKGEGRLVRRDWHRRSAGPSLATRARCRRLLRRPGRAAAAPVGAGSPQALGDIRGRLLLLLLYIHECT